MKKTLILAAALAAFGFCGAAQAAGPGPYDLPLVGEYVNDAGMVVIAPAAKSQGANYDVGIISKDGKCQIQIVAGTNKVSAQSEKMNGAKFNPKAIAAVESEKFPNFSLWPEDETIKLAPDALPFDQLDKSCSVFKNNMTFTRKAK